MTFYIHLGSTAPTCNCIHHCQPEHPNRSTDPHMNICTLHLNFCIRCATVSSQKTKVEYFTRESPQTNQWTWNVEPQPVSPVSYLMLLLLDAQEILSADIRGPSNSAAKSRTLFLCATCFHLPETFLQLVKACLKTWSSLNWERQVYWEQVP